VITPKRKLKDLIVDLIALVRSPASAFRFSVIKGYEGGDKRMDEILALVQEICGEDDLKDLTKASIPDSAIEGVSEALSTVKGAIGDLPDSVQTAIKTLVKIAGYGYPTEKAEDSEEKKEDLVSLLEDIQAQVVNADKKFESAVQETKKAQGDIQKSLESLSSRLTKLEEVTGKEQGRAAEDIVEKGKKKDEDDLWQGVVPNRVML